MQNFVSIQTRTSLKKSDVSWPIDEKCDVSREFLIRRCSDAGISMLMVSATDCGLLPD